MDTSHLIGGLERFSKRKDVDTTLSSITAAAGEINTALSDASKEYDSVMVFSHSEGSPVAVPLTTLESSDAQWYRHRFRKESVENRSVVLSGTALGRALRDPAHAGYANSAINDELPQMVYTEPLIHEGQLVGALQHSFTPANGKDHFENLLGDSKVEAIAHANRDALTQTAASIAVLQSLSQGMGSLDLLLEREEAIAPDMFAVRIDTVSSRDFARGPQHTAYDAYQSQSQVYIRRLLQAYQERYLVDQFGIHEGYSDQGDGAYLALPLPTGYNPYSARELANYRHYTAEPFMTDIRTGLEAIGRQYIPDLAPTPQVKVHGAFGNIAINGVGRLVSPVFTELAEHKEKSPH